ncbi:MAG TPA: glycosyltransferase family 4 protein [Candidatus Aquicultor sp.]
MRLLILTTIAPTIRGFLMPFAQHFRNLGWQVDAMANGVSNCDDCRANFDNIWEVAWSRSPLDVNNFSRSINRVQSLVRQNKYDIVHVHTPVASFVARLALREVRLQGKLKVVYTAHGFHFYKGGSPLKNTAFRSLEKLAGRWTDYLVVMNQEDREAALRYRIVAPDRVRYMPGIGIDTALYNAEQITEPAIAAVRSEIGLGKNEPLFVMVAEFIRRKRHKVVLQAFARLAHRRAHLALVGDGPLMDEQRALAQELGIVERVHFMGHRNDVSTIMRSSVATLLPSVQEGLPRCVMESMSLKTPVIGSDIRGTRDLLCDDCGLLVRAGDIEGFARAMSWILANPDKARAMGFRGHAKIVTGFDTRNIVALHERLYADAVGEELPFAG